MPNENPGGTSKPVAEGRNRPGMLLRVGADRTAVNLELVPQGRDFLLRVTGGDAHVGAVAVWDSGKLRGPSSVDQMAGHREGPLALDCAEILGRASGRTVVAVVGIHQDNATPGEIEAISANVRQGARDMAAALAAEMKDR